MTSRPAIGIAVAAAIAALVSALPPIIERLSPPTGLVRSVFPQPGIRRRADGCANDRNQSEIPRRAARTPPSEFQREMARISSTSRSRRRSSFSPAATTKSSFASMESCFSGGVWPKG